MSFATSRVFKSCRGLLAPAKQAAATASKTATSSVKPKVKSAPKPKPATPTRPTGILKPVPISPALRDFLGVPETSRTEAVKMVWVHIKENNLQNPTDKREIFCDEKLKIIFDGKEKVGFLEIAKLLSPHFVKAG